MDHTDIITRSVTVEGRTVHASAAAPLEPMLETLLAVYAERSQDLHEGYTVWYVWGPIMLQDGDNASDLVAQCPDYGTDPRSARTSDLTLALSAVANMTVVTTASQVEGEEIAYDDDVICAIGWENADMLQMSRTATTTDGDSGWFIEPFPSERAEPWATDELVRLPAWRVTQLRPATMKALALPVGIVAIIQQDHLRAVIREDDREVLATDL